MNIKNPFSRFRRYKEMEMQQLDQMHEMLIVSNSIKDKMCVLEDKVSKALQDQSIQQEKLNRAEDMLQSQQEQLLQQKEEIEHLNELLRRNIHDTNMGFFDINYEKHKRFGGAHAIYNDEFYRQNRYASFTSGVHILRPLLKRINITNVVDFGCGTGTWLYAAKKLNAKQVLGIDGDYVNRDLLMIDKSEFQPFDLEKPITLKQQFDLAISVEVAEHLHETTADQFVSSICASSDLVLFSAAHKNQGGDYHINEQPFSYWKQKFSDHGYQHIEIRTFYCGDWEIESWYRENIGLYVKPGRFNDIQSSLSDLLAKVNN